MLKIALVNQPWGSIEPPVQAGSIPILIYQTALRLAQSHTVSIFSRGHFRRKARSCEGINYVYVPVFLDKFLLKVNEINERYFSTGRSLFHANFYYLIYVLQIAWELRLQKYDIVHLHNFSQFAPIIRALNPKIKIVLHMHCEWLTQLPQDTVAKRLQHIDLVIGCSEYITNKNRARFPQFAERCQTVFNGVNVAHFTETGQKLTAKETVEILFVSRVSPEKGVHILLDAFCKITSAYPQARLKIVGPAESVPFDFIVGLTDDPQVLQLAPFYKVNYLEYLQQGIPSDLLSRIHFVGAVPHAQLVEYYHQADVLIQPSLSEAFGMSLTEAMAMEVPVIASCIGGMADVVEDGKTGLLVEPGNSDELAEAMRRLLANQELRRKMGRAGRQRVLEFFSWDKVTENLLAQYNWIYEGDRSYKKHYVSQNSDAAVL